MKEALKTIGLFALRVVSWPAYALLLVATVNLGLLFAVADLVFGVMGILGWKGARGVAWAADDLFWLWHDWVLRPVYRGTVLYTQHAHNRWVPYVRQLSAMTGWESAYIPQRRDTGWLRDPDPSVGSTLHPAFYEPGCFMLRTRSHWLFGAQLELYSRNQDGSIGTEIHYGSCADTVRAAESFIKEAKAAADERMRRMM